MKEKKTKNVLLVEDNLICREMVKVQLTHQGYHVDIANNVAMAIKKLNKNFYSLILTDLHLPDNLGSEVIKFVRQSIKYQKIPLILGSAQLSKADIPKYINLGADAVLIKPYSTKILLYTINNFL